MLVFTTRPQFSRLAEQLVPSRCEVLKAAPQQPQQWAQRPLRWKAPSDLALLASLPQPFDDETQGKG